MEDIATIAKIVIILVILCSVVAIVFALVTMLKKMANSNSAQLQNGMGQIQDSQFQDYDQAVITGTQVMAAMKIFEGQPVAFRVVTGVQQSGVSCAHTTNPGYGTNYGALLVGVGTSKDADQASDGKIYPMTKTLTKDPGKSYYKCDLDVTTGSFQYNLNTKPTTTSGSCTYIRSSAKYLAELIKDSTDTTVGISFIQVLQ